MFATGGLREHPLDLLAAQDHRELSWLAWPRNLERGAIALQRRVIEEAETVHDNVHRTPRSVPIPQEMAQVILHLLIRNLVGRPVVVPRQSFDRPHVRLSRPVGHPPHEHVLVHATP